MMYRYLMLRIRARPGKDRELPNTVSRRNKFISAEPLRGTMDIGFIEDFLGLIVSGAVVFIAMAIANKKAPKDQ